VKSVMKTPFKPAAVGGALFAGLSLSGLASAGSPVGGTIVFVASETAGPALPVPTLGVMAAVL